MQHYYFRTIEKSTAGILDMFNDIYIKQNYYNKSTNSYGLVDYRIPIEISTKNKVLRDFQILYQNDGVKRYYNVPKFVLIINGITKSEDRQTNQMNTIKNNLIENDADGKQILKFIKNPSWYNAEYTLSIITRRMDDMTQILEQILPIFQPQYSLNIKLIPEINLATTLPVTISNQVNFEINQDMEPNSVRMIMTDLTLSVPVPLFPPIREGKIINKIITRFSPIAGNSMKINTQEQEIFYLYGDQGITNPLKLKSNLGGSWILSREGITRPLRMI